MPVADTLLRLAADAEFYSARWSPEILGEVHRTLLKFGYPEEKVQRRVRTMQEIFPEAMIEGYDHLVQTMTNHPKDRHVLAAAVKCGAHAIVSNNRKHFPPQSLAPYGLECLTADEFLSHQYHLDPDEFIVVLTQQAADTKVTLAQLLSRHEPCLSKLIRP